MSDIQTSTFKGARYVPKFEGIWDSTKSYEAITAVQYGAFTYLSKQPVPAGVEITNTNYWILWADPNAQMEQLRQEVLDYVHDVENLESIIPSVDFNSTNTVKKYVDDTKTELTTHTFAVIGDSWSAGSVNGSWVPELATEIGWNYVNKAQNGMGFVYGSNTFINQLTALNNDTTIDNDSIDIIIVFGGVNDWNHEHQTFDTPMKSAITNLYNYAKTNFPKSKFVICGINTYNDWTRHITFANEMQKFTEKLGCSFVNTVGWLQYDEHWTSDPYHPTVEGYKKIQGLMKNIVLGIPFTLPVELNTYRHEFDNMSLNAVLRINPNSFTVVTTLQLTVQSEITIGNTGFPLSALENKGLHTNIFNALNADYLRTNILNDMRNDNKYGVFSTDTVNIYLSALQNSTIPANTYIITQRSVLTV